MSAGGARAMEIDDLDGVIGQHWARFWEGRGSFRCARGDRRGETRTRIPFPRLLPNNERRSEVVGRHH
jgi:hypothetical protein